VHFRPPWVQGKNMDFHIIPDPSYNQ
jgi:hypothetical protein